jgi:hypothetical protein
MEAYVSAVRDDDGTVQFIDVDDGIGIYCDHDDDFSVWARTADGDVSLGFRDASVSRMREDGAPIRLNRSDGRLYVRNVDNNDDIYLEPVDLMGEKTALERGESERITDDTVVDLGWETTLLVTVEQAEANEVDSVQGDIPTGKYVSALCEHLGEKQQRTGVYRIAQQLLDTVDEHPLDTANWEEARDDLAEQVLRLEGGDMDEDLGQKRLDLVETAVKRIEKQYLGV